MEIFLLRRGDILFLLGLGVDGIGGGFGLLLLSPAVLRRMGGGTGGALLLIDETEY